MQWVNNAGPRRVKPVTELLDAIKWEARTYSEIGYDGSKHSYTELFGSSRSEVVQRVESVKEKYGGNITVKNLPEIKADLESVLAWATETRPIVRDSRVQAAAAL